MVHVAIGVITCKRPAWLSRLLDSLIIQEINGDVNVTIFVVDNAIDEETKSVVLNKVISNSQITLHYDTEPQAGIVFARNKCVELFEEAEADFLLFIDDDEWTRDTDWIQRLLDAAGKYGADIVTSRVISTGADDVPNWAIELIYGDNPYSEGDPVKVFYTNNLLLSKNAIEKTIPCFDARFAMTGASDYHFALRCNHLGLSCVYTEAPVIEEFPKSRASVKWFCRRGFRSGVGYTRSHMFEEQPVKAVIRVCLMSGVRVARGILSVLTGIFTTDKRKLVDGLFRFSAAAGTIAGLFGVKHEEYKVIHGK